MTSKIFSIASFVLMVWLAYSGHTTATRIQAIEQKLAQQEALNEEVNAQRTAELTKAITSNTESSLKKYTSQTTSKINESLDGIASKVTNDLDQKQQENKKQLMAKLDQIASKPAAALPQKKNEAVQSNKPAAEQTGGPQKDLSKALKLALEAESEKTENAAQAAEKLLSIKGSIWKSGDAIPQAKEELRKLMGPIDYIASQWKAGENSRTVDSVTKVLQDTLQKLQANK